MLQDMVDVAVVLVMLIANAGQNLWKHLSHRGWNLRFASGVSDVYLESKSWPTT